MNQLDVYAVRAKEDGFRTRISICRTDAGSWYAVVLVNSGNRDEHVVQSTALYQSSSEAFAELERGYR